MMNDEELEQVFSKEDDITPSSGFVMNVMGAVRRDAETPPAIAFP